MQERNDSFDFIYALFAALIIYIQNLLRLLNLVEPDSNQNTYAPQTKLYRLRNASTDPEIMMKKKLIAPAAHRQLSSSIFINKEVSAKPDSPVEESVVSASPAAMRK